MTSNQNILVKLNQAGFRLKNKWLVKGVSLQIEKGKIVNKDIIDKINGNFLMFSIILINF